MMSGLLSGGLMGSVEFGAWTICELFCFVAISLGT